MSGIPLTGYTKDKTCPVINCTSGDTHGLPLCPEFCPYKLKATNPELYRQLFPRS